MHVKQNKAKAKLNLKKNILLGLPMLHSPSGFDRFMVSFRPVINRAPERINNDENATAAILTCMVNITNINRDVVTEKNKRQLNNKRKL